ncbi:sorting nexin-29 isoform X1 [Onthophagus taurus]|uniref:sorting nexin-29 isoform X1 n=2 Tax=Onthophagus taurus TaxID=166361 RepID=UPI0039BE7C6D
MSLKLMSTVISSSVAPQKTEESGKLIQQLLDCVKKCQTRYGGKKELATEYDSCVAALCLTLESVLLHGLRNKPLVVQQISTLKQVSDIVSNSLHLNNDNISFWPFVSKHLTKHENERYAILKQIWTDTGRGKAWIRSALNEKSLERYFQSLVNNKELLKIYYEDWALLYNEEQSSLLPNMAAGLGSILFAISIDKSEFNCGNAMEKMDKLKSMAEPIIDAPIPENTQKKKRKIPKQIISFDDDETTSLSLSSSVPSSSSSITSDTLPTEIDKKPPDNNEKQQIRRKLSIETSGSRDKFSFTSLEGPLTPLTQANIGELTPISNKNPESPDDPIDISNVFTEIERKNLDIVRLNEKIGNLTIENENLREQLKKYISAVQLLKQENAVIDENVSTQNLNPDYRKEAKIFETKLVQVAEMHAELIDFNVILQKKLCAKDRIIDRLSDELEEIRGPVGILDEDDDSRRVVNVWIPSAFLTGSGSTSHHVYQIFLRAGRDEWNIYRRYAQFYALHTDLKKLDPAVSTFDFPPKKSIGKKDANLVEGRRKRLQKYLRNILSHWPELSQCNSRFLLEQHFSFFKDQECDKNIFSPRRSPNDTHHAGL